MGSPLLLVGKTARQEFGPIITSDADRNMLKKVEFDHFDSEELAGGDSSHLLRPDYYWQLVKRRWLYFLVPFLLVASAGTAAAWLWPATYLSEGKILVQSQQIPTELVRPTVTNSAQERIQVIEPSSAPCRAII
jgi:hypothetical protein